ncbi:MAG: hypothetical protein KAR14_14175 [Candidatus Aminicenantes bacterium]|nr:hypothetical protein [Candidatus Aminicenantes bacterium]
MNRSISLKLVSITFIFFSISGFLSGFMKLSGEPGENKTPESKRAELIYMMSRSEFETREFDSYTCLSCHDGIIAEDTHMTPGNSDVYNSPSIGLSHPVRINYVEIWQRYPMKLHSPDSLGPYIRLYDNKLECLSCHDPESEKDHYLVMDNFRSRLCLSCHNK